MEITGVIKSISPVAQKTSKAGKTYQTATVVVETQEAKPNSMAFQLIDAKITELVDIGVGNLVRVRYACNVREWNGKMLNNVYVLGIERQVVTQNAQPYQPSF